VVAGTDFGLREEDLDRLLGDAPEDDFCDPPFSAVPDRFDEVLESDAGDDAPLLTDHDFARYVGEDEPLTEAPALAWVQDVFGEGVENVRARWA